MIDIENILKTINEVVILPLSIIIFFILIHIANYMSKKDPDVIRSRIFLKYYEIKRAFVLLVAFAFILILHVTLIYYPHIFYFFLECSSSLIDHFQNILGLILVIILISFVFIIYKSLKDSISPL